MTEQNEALQQVVEGSVRSHRIRNVISSIRYDIPQTKEFSENDRRRRLPIQGLSLLDAAISAIAQKDQDLTTHATAGLPEGVDQLSDFRDLITHAQSYSQVISEMRSLIEQHLAQARSTWETISSRRVQSDKPLTPDDEPENKTKWKMAVEDEYYWNMRLQGFDLGLQALGIDRDDQGSLVPGVAQPVEKLLPKVESLPTQDLFNSQQFSRANDWMPKK